MSDSASTAKRRTRAPQPAAKAAAAAQPPKPDDPPLIVGIGASAGGLEAYKSFFAHMPAGSAMAFVLVQHLAPQHTSLLAELVGRSTAMEVLEATDGEPVQAGHVYVIPPDATLTIADGTLHLTKPAPPRQHRWPIDTFFMSLAEDQGDNAVCIVLSGSDGARGLRAVKEHGGLTLAQAGLDHAAMSGMPASAAATGLVDDVLQVEEMPARLLAHQQHLRATREQAGPDGIRLDVPSHLLEIARLLHADSGHDFSQYKEKTLVRRIQRRMQVLQMVAAPDYVQHLRQDPGELEHLFRELLISVTEFFRDPAAFELLAKRVIPGLLAGKTAADTVRVWVSGCATGEEAYSIAIVLKEAMGPCHGQPKVQIFATDIDDRAIGAARAGRFRAPLTGVSPERLERWFQQDGDDYVVSKAIRELCIFCPHSAIKDPPFMRLDLISCRNLLIYMNAELQERLIRVFHYALAPGGHLLLGPSEGLSRNVRLFSVVDKKHRLYQSREDGHAHLPLLPLLRPPVPAYFAVRPAAASSNNTEDQIERNARRVLEPYSPAYVVIDANHDVLRFCGDTGRYLQPSSGTASLNLFALLHRGLRAAARSAIQQAFARQQSVLQDGLSLIIEGQRRTLQLIVEPLPEAEGATQLCAVLFRERQSALPSAAHPGDKAADSRHTRRTQLLEQELDTTRLQLQTAVDQQETYNEELKSANEEYQSVNEELQSSNEELETSKEEMQSINEELQIVNAELQSKNTTLNRLNSDLRNLMDSTEIGTLFLDSQLHITGFTPAITALFHLRQGDLGRPITEISARIPYPDLADDVKQVGRSLVMSERLLQGHANGPVYLARMRPYRTIDNHIDGVVLTFTDITERRRHEVQLGQLAAIVDSSRDIIIGHTMDGAITSWNASAVETLGYSAASVIGKALALLLPPHSSHLPQLLGACTGPETSQLAMTWRHRDGSDVQVEVICSPVRDSDGEVIAGSLIAREIGERQRAVAHTQLMLGELNHRVKNTLASVQSIAMQTLTHAVTPKSFNETFLARLHALSGTHNLLAADHWNGALLHQVVLAELAPYDDGKGRTEVSGCDLQLTPKAALALSMALHELTTNAAKYGALSVPQGQVVVQCELQTQDGAPWLDLQWRESGGPLVSQPSRRGFGSRLIAEGLGYELDGVVTLRFEPAGVTCHIAVPLSEAAAAP